MKELMKDTKKLFMKELYTIFFILYAILTIFNLMNEIMKEWSIIFFILYAILTIFGIMKTTKKISIYRFLSKMSFIITINSFILIFLQDDISMHIFIHIFNVIIFFINSYMYNKLVKKEEQRDIYLKYH